MRSLREIGVISALISVLGIGYSAGCDGKTPILQIGGYSTTRDAGNSAAHNETRTATANSSTNSICESLNAPAGMCARYSGKQVFSSGATCTVDDLVYSTKPEERMQIAEGSQSDGYYRSGRKSYAGRLLVEGPARCKGKKMNVTIEFTLTMDDKTKIKEEYDEYKRQNLANVAIENTPANIAGKSLVDYYIPTRGEVVRISFRNGEQYKYEQKTYKRSKKSKKIKISAPQNTNVRVSGMFDYCIRPITTIRHEMKVNRNTRSTDFVAVKNAETQQCATRKGWMLFGGKKDQRM